MRSNNSLERTNGPRPFAAQLMIRYTAMDAAVDA